MTRGKRQGPRPKSRANFLDSETSYFDQLRGSWQAWESRGTQFLVCADVLKKQIEKAVTDWTASVKSRLPEGETQVRTQIDESNREMYVLSGSMRVVYLLQAIAAENILKALIVLRNPDVVKDAKKWRDFTKGHNLRRLASTYSIPLGVEEFRGADVAKELIESSKYPVPKNGEEFLFQWSDEMEAYELPGMVYERDAADLAALTNLLIALLAVAVNPPDGPEPPH